jgi:hypothetical protein
MLQVPVLDPSAYLISMRLWAKVVRFMPQCMQSAGCSTTFSAALQKLARAMISASDIQILFIKISRK